jgi:hypothetical protein
MNDTSIFYVICGFIMGYAVFNIVDIIKTNIKIKVVNHMIKDMKDKVKAHQIDMTDKNPLVAAYKTLLLIFPESKVKLYDNNNSLIICYGHSCVVIINRPDEDAISIGIGVDKTTRQSEKNKSAEFNELKELLESCNFDETNFARALALLVVKLQKAETTKYSKVSRQIPHDML